MMTEGCLFREKNRLVDRSPRLWLVLVLLSRRIFPVSGFVRHRIMHFPALDGLPLLGPSAPAAIPARAMADTSFQFPVLWLGSRITGKCVAAFNTGIALISVVFLVAVSKVRMPRSQRITLLLPWERIYSAAIKSSSTVALIPRFNKTGCWLSPAACSRG